MAVFFVIHENSPIIMFQLTSLTAQFTVLVSVSSEQVTDSEKDQIL